MMERAHGGDAPGVSTAVGVLLVVQLWLAASFAVHTPAWQNPDEPAHFNYIAQLARDPASPPAISPSDYDPQRIADVMARTLPARSAVDDITYEDHQPPAYYYAMLPVVLVHGGSPEARLLAVRLAGALLGLITTALAFVFVRWAWRRQPWLAVCTAAIVGLIPMHLSMSGSANNDALATPVMAAVLVVALGIATGRARGARRVLYPALAMAVAFYVKLTVYIAVIPLVVALLLPPRHRSSTGWTGFGTSPGKGARLRQAVLACTVAAAVASPWWIRNILVYGGFDPFGLAAHGRAVHGQLTSAALLEDAGWGGLLGRGFSFTFQSFWGVFGWMAVFLDRRIYWLLGAVSIVGLVGFVRWAWSTFELRPRRTGPIDGGPAARRAIIIAGASAAATTLGFIWYNLHYVQHQGRYFLPAILAVAMILAVGTSTIIGELLDRASARRWTDAAPQVAAVCWSIGLAGIAWLALSRYVIPGLAPAT